MKHKKKHRGRNYHHLRPKSRNGTYSDKNLLLIDIDKHRLWHELWGNRTLDEIISLLLRTREMKNHQGGA